MWVKQVKTPHRCSLPMRLPAGLAFGSIWECDECHTQWKARPPDLFNPGGLVVWSNLFFRRKLK